MDIKDFVNAWKKLIASSGVVETINLGNGKKMQVSKTVSGHIFYGMVGGAIKKAGKAAYHETLRFARENA